MADATTTNATPLLGQKGSGQECKYYKRKLIGTGSYGEAWLAERVTDGSIFVCKVMDLGKMSARDKQYACTARLSALPSKNTFCFARVV